MENNSKQLAKNTVYLYIRMVIVLLINLYISRAVLQSLGVEDYGIYNIVGGFVSMLSLFTSTVTSAVQRFITFELGAGDSAKLKTTFSTLVKIIFLLSLLIIVIGEIFGLFFMDSLLVIPQERLAASHIVYQGSLVIFIANLIGTPFTACVIAHEKMNFFALSSILDAVLKLISVVVLFYIIYDHLIAYIIFMASVAIVILFINIIYCRKHFEESGIEKGINKNIAKNVFSYSAWVSIGASSAILKEQGVNVLINMFYGVLLNAARGVSMQVYGLATLFAGNVGQAISPQITKSYAAGDVKKSIDLTIFSTKIQGVLLILIIAPLFVEVDYILRLWLVDVPEYAVSFTKWSLFLAFARTMESTHGPLFLATGEVRNLQIIAGGVMILNLPVSYFCLLFGLPAVSTMGVGIIFEVIVMFIVYKYLQIKLGFPLNKYFRHTVLPLFLSLLVSVVILFSIKELLDFHPFINLLLIVLMSCVLTTCLAYLFILDRNERKSILNIIKNKMGIK